MVPTSLTTYVCGRGICRTAAVQTQGLKQTQHMRQIRHQAQGRTRPKFLEKPPDRSEAHHKIVLCPPSWFGGRFGGARRPPGRAGCVF